MNSGSTRARAFHFLPRKMMEQTKKWLAMLAIPRWGPRRALMAAEQAGGVAEAWARCCHENPSACTTAWEVAVRWMDDAHHHGMDTVGWNDVRYPSLLRHIADPPPVLFGRGRWPDPRQWPKSLAVVGTRQCTELGAKRARGVALEWSQAGGLMVSGLARGVDACAHRAVLDGPQPGHQVAVLPCGLEAVHPHMHWGLAESIVDAGGLVVSEQPPGRQVERWMFASRNRIVTGLSAATLVVQSPRRGGSLISARCAHDQDREVYAFWEKGMGTAWAGNRMLVSDGLAHPVEGLADLWRAMAKGAQGMDASALRKRLGFPSGCEEVWKAMAQRSGPVPRATLASLSGMSEEGLSRQLFTLEVQGWIRRLPGRAYLRV